MEMLMMLAKLMPFEFLLERLEESIDEYKIVPTEENKKALIMAAMMITLNDVTKNSSVADVMDDMNEKKAIIDSYQKLKTQS